ncbi:MAG: hypothetical protein GC164_16355 [Phycisphaera sp.]|nr:hypothetical protein [Phycisphaera sp.]
MSEPLTENITDHTPTTAATPADLGPAALCPHCDYDLRAAIDPVCPECGKQVDLEKIRQCRIPWVHRQKIGRLRALFATAWLFTRFPRWLPHEAQRELDYHEAVRFQRWVVTIFTVCLFVVCSLPLVPRVLDPYDPLPTTVLVAMCIQVLMLWPTLDASTSVHTYWCHPGNLPVERQNACVALAHYACGPLLWLGFTLVITVLGLIAKQIEHGLPIQIANGIVILVFGFMSVIAVITFYVTCLYLIGKAAGRGAGATWGAAILLPILWLLILVIGQGLIPWGFAYAALLVSVW